MPKSPLRVRLQLLAASAILPLALVSALALSALLERQREQTRESTLNITRAMATAIDNELRLTVSALEVLAQSVTFASAASADLRRAHELARQVLQTRPEWWAIHLLTPGGQVVFTTSDPFGQSGPQVVEADSFIHLVRSGQPAIGVLTKGRADRFGIPVRVPVVRDGSLRYVLSAIVRPDAILQVVQRQQVPDSWVVSVFDAAGHRVARSRDHERQLGAPAAPSLQTMMAELGDRDASTGFTESLEGERVQTAVARVNAARWTVALGVPQADIESAVRDSAIAYGGGILLSLLLGGTAAWFVSRSVTRPMARLGNAALAIGQDAPMPAIQSDVIEIEAVAEALRSASTQRQRNEADRQQLLDAERRARAAAEQTQRRLERLAQAGTLLSATLDEEATLQAIAAIVVPGLADACRIDLLDADGQLQRKLTHHTDPERARAIEQFVRTHQSSADTVGSFPWVIRTGSLHYLNIERPQEFFAGDPMFVSFAELVGLRAVCVTPLVARGRTIGAMAAIHTDSGRTFQEADAALVGQIAQRAALALDNVRLYADAQDALRRAEAAGRVKDEFLAMLGHELRNPLAPIVTSLEIMTRRHDDRSLRERSVIERQVRHLSRLVDDLLDVSRIATGKIELNREHIDLRSVLSQAGEQVQALLRARERPLELSLPPQPLWVLGDAPRLTQVVTNLLTNAIKFTAGDRRIALRLEGDDDVRITVSDDGDGIAPALLPLIFDRFVQGEQALQRAKGGLGLGLAIARNIVELHGGRIAAHSAGLGHGSEFVVTLPRAPQAVAREPAPPALSPARAATVPQRVLIVDDNEDAARSLEMLLSLDGHLVRTASTGHAALQVLQSFVPDVALLDIGLPDVDGYELARRLRADERTQATWLIALTGYGTASDLQQALHAGFDEHLTKPVEPEVLAERLDHAQRRATAVAQSAD